MVPYKPQYWHLIAPFAKRSIAKRFGREVADRAYAKGAQVYRDLLLCAPDLGDDNPMLGTFCESMVFVALWMGAEGAISVDGLRQMTADVLGIPVLKAVGLVKNGNRSLDFQLEGMKNTEAWAQAHEGEFDSAWRVRFDDALHRDGIFFEYTRCPIAEYMAELGVSEVTPAICELDHLMCKLIHSKLYREHTIADGAATCDYWIVGDKIENPR